MSTWTTKLEEDHSHHHALAATSAVSASDAALSAANAAEKKGTKKLNKEGMAIILDFVNKNNGGELRITKAQAQEVATEIRIKTGYEEITFTKVQDWVKRRRVTVSKSNSQVAAPPVTPYASASSSASSTSPVQGLMFNFRYWTQVPVSGSSAPAAPVAPPSSIWTSALTSPQISILESLISQFPDGVDDVQISTWANGLNVDRDLVKKLVGSRQRNQTPSLPLTPISPSTVPNRHSWLLPDPRSFADRIAQTNANSHQRLPTPADTVSSADAMEVDPNPLIQTPLPVLDPETRFIDPIVKGILEGVKGAACAPAVLPRTAAELNALWAPFETKLNQLTESLAR
ncbi:hypothetical protein H1R20_g5563, partial [Candolleomyces eurysporus]